MDACTIPTQKHFTKVAMPSLVSQVRGKNLIEGKLPTYFSTMTDLWTSASGDPYFTVTCHFIDSCWVIKTYCVQTHYIPECC